MAQSLEVNIKATSDVPQAVDRAKEAITSLEKRASTVKVGTTGGAVEQTTSKATSMVGSQFEKIGKSFGNTISSVFLSFAGPLAIISGIISFVSGAIAEAKRLSDEGVNRIAEGKTDLATDEERKLANFFKAKDAREKEIREVEAGRATLTQRFLTETVEGRKITRESGRGFMPGTEAAMIARDPAIQKRALDAFLRSDEGKKYAAFFEPEKATKNNTFKPPEGFGNVIGVGQNPVMEAMNAQLEEQKKTNTILEKIAYDPGATSWMNSTPSRAAMLTGK